MHLWNPTQPRRYRLYLAAAVSAALLIGAVFWNTNDASLRGDSEQVLAIAGKSEAATAAHLNPSAAGADYDRLNPADFVAPLSSFGSNPMYAEARLRIYCGNHVKTRGDLDDAGNRNVILRVDPSGQYLKQPVFERKVADEQCREVVGDEARISELMTAAGQQGVKPAQAWLLDKRYEEVTADLRSLSDDSPERRKAISALRDMLPQARELAETGDGRVALMLSKITATDTFDQKDPTESLKWLLLATQVRGKEFQISQAALQNEPYRELSQNDVERAAADAQKIFSQCCSTSSTDSTTISPFLSLGGH